jgi:hypothetical protein
MFLSEPLLRAINQERARELERIARDRRLLSEQPNLDAETPPADRTITTRIPVPASRARGSACEAS